MTPSQAQQKHSHCVFCLPFNDFKIRRAPHLVLGFQSIQLLGKSVLRLVVPKVASHQFLPREGGRARRRTRGRSPPASYLWNGGDSAPSNALGCQAADTQWRGRVACHVQKVPRPARIDLDAVRHGARPCGLAVTREAGRPG